LEKLEAVTDSVKREKQWAVSGCVKMFNREDTYCKSNKYMTHTGSEGLPPKRI
jgi:hypothetical protein